MIHLTRFVFCMLLVNTTFASGLWYEFSGDITSITDKTADGAIESHYGDGAARYVVYIDSSEAGYWISATGVILPRSYYYDDSRYTLFYYADYACGNAIDVTYYGYEYFQIKSYSSNSTMSSTVNVGHRLDIVANSTFANWYIGMAAEGKDYYRDKSSSEATSYAKSNLVLSNIYSSNPCH